MQTACKVHFIQTVNTNGIEEFPEMLKSVIGEILIPGSGPKGHCLGIAEYINLREKKASIGTFCAFAYLSKSLAVRS